MEIINFKLSVSVSLLEVTNCSQLVTVMVRFC